MTRPAYKAKYLEARASAARWRDRAEAVRRELERVRGVLAAEGAAVAEQLPKDGHEPIYLSPLRFECITAFMAFNMRIASDPWAFDPKDPQTVRYAWRGRPLFPIV